MKKISMLFLGGVIFASCNSGHTSSNEVTKDSSATMASTAKMDYPYTIDHPDNWERGSNQNTMVALSALKAYENGNVDESLKSFGDSIQVQFDGMDTKLSNDSLKAFFTKARSNYKSMNIKMDDWESVVSKDKKDEWVTLWYRQKWEDEKGKMDSVDVINDLKMKDGKIVRLDEYTRKLH